MLEDLDSLERIVLFGFGEALCNPEFMSLANSIRTLNKKIVLISNAFFLTEEIAETLIDLPVHELFVSWDDNLNGNRPVIRSGADPDLFKKNIEYLIKLKAGRESVFPDTGIEIVAQKNNLKHVQNIVKYGKSIGIDKYIISNLFPYSEKIAENILFTLSETSRNKFTRLISKIKTEENIRIASDTADRNRKCPFIEKGTVFINAHGFVSPCPELAYSHDAYYFMSKRHHTKRHFGNISKLSIAEIWEKQEFKNLRHNFLYYFFPDCATCYHSEICYHRTVRHEDCFSNVTPCGECLWARDIIICP